MFSKKEPAEEAYRELNVRCSIYPSWVRANKIKQADADRAHHESYIFFFTAARAISRNLSEEYLLKFSSLSKTVEWI